MKILFCILVLLFSCSFVYAHTCATFRNLPDKEHSKKLQELDYIFEGELVSYTNLDEFSSLNTYKVLRVWKGNIPAEVTVKFDNPCITVAKTPSEPTGIPIKVSKTGKVLIYGYKVKDEPFINVNCCNFGLFDDTRMKLEYGEGIAIEQPTPEAKQPPEEGFLSALWKTIVSFFS